MGLPKSGQVRSYVSAEQSKVNTSPMRPGWQVIRDGADAELHLTGDWIARDTGLRDAAAVHRLLADARPDDLILELREGLGATIVIVSHELASLFAICDDGVFLDAQAQTAIAHGAPRRLRDECENPAVRAFMTRERPDHAAP